jgi:hypothetical protein
MEKRGMEIRFEKVLRTLPQGRRRRALLQALIRLGNYFAIQIHESIQFRGHSWARLEVIVPGRTYNFYRLFQSTTHPAIYHAGQIALLKKLRRS